MATTNAKEWKKGKKGKYFELEVPSGNTCLVRRPGPDLFTQQGNIPNSLLGVVMPLLEQAQAEGKKGDSTPMPDDAFVELQKAIIEDADKLKDMFAMMDSIVVSCVVAPVVHPISKREEIMADESIPEEERLEKIEDMLFVDEVDFEDKAAIFNYAVGGTADLERFRSGTAALVAAGQDGPAVPQSSE